MTRPGHAAALVVVAWSLAAAGSQAQELEWTQWSVAAGGNGHEYAVVPAIAYWPTQEAAAEAQGAYLATITSADENAFVFSVLTSFRAEHPSTAHWYAIGLYQEPGSAEPEGGWCWLNNEGTLADTGYSNWSTYEPNNGGLLGGNYTNPENYGSMLPDGMWNDIGRFYSVPAIFERLGPSVDETPPALSLDPPDPATLPWSYPGVLTAVVMSGQVTDDDSGVASATLTVTDEYGECNGTFDVTDLLDAGGIFSTTVYLCGNVDAADFDGRSYVISLSAADNAGNAGGPVSVGVLAPPDTTAPEVSLNPADPSELPTTDPGTLKPVTISGHVADGESGIAMATVSVADEYGECGGDYDVTALLGADGRFEMTVDLSCAVNPGDADGRSYAISLSATDNAGNAGGPVSVNVLAPPDTTAPEVSLDPADPSELPTTEPGTLKPVTISGHVADGESGIAMATVSVADEYGEFSAPHDVTGLLDAAGNFTLTLELSSAVNPDDADGRSYAISLSATDNAGNAGGPVSVNVLAPPDTTAPTAALYPPDPELLSSAQPDVLKPVSISGCVTDAQSGVDWAAVTVIDEYGEFGDPYDVAGLLDAEGKFTLGLELSSRVLGGDSDGRLYEIVLTTCDCSGNAAGPVSVFVRAERPGPGNNPGDDHRPPHAGPPDDPGNGNGNGPRK